MDHIRSGDFLHFFGLTLTLSSLLFGCGADRHLGARLVVTPPSEEVRKTQTDAWLAEIKSLGSDGDWLAVRGYHASDHFVVAVTNIPISHIAILDLKNERVIEAKAEGVILTPLREFVHHAHRVILIRPKWWTQERGLAAVEEASSLVGKGYDFSGLVGVSSDDRFYCSELAFHLYRAEHKREDHIPLVIEPGQAYLWGQVRWDSTTRD